MPYFTHPKGGIGYQRCKTESGGVRRSKGVRERGSSQLGPAYPRTQRHETAEQLKEWRLHLWGSGIQCGFGSAQPSGVGVWGLASGPLSRTLHRVGVQHWVWNLSFESQLAIGSVLGVIGAWALLGWQWENRIAYVISQWWWQNKPEGHVDGPRPRSPVFFPKAVVVRPVIAYTLLVVNLHITTGLFSF